MIRKTVHYFGRVQGVGFRYTTCQLAADFAVVGHVRNLPDGRVELVAEGDPEEIERFLSAVARTMTRNIREATNYESPATGEFDRFQVRF
jgi:acylphosphatase